MTRPTDEQIDAVVVLAGLLASPQPGLTTWHMACESAWQRIAQAEPTTRTLYRVTTSIAGVDEESRSYRATEAEARKDVLEWRNMIGDDTGDAWDVYAHRVQVDVPANVPTELVLQLLNEASITEASPCLIANRCKHCDGPIEDEENTNAFAVDVEPLTVACAECAAEMDGK